MCEELTRVKLCPSLTLLLTTREKHASGTGCREEGAGGIQKHKVTFGIQYPEAFNWYLTLMAAFSSDLFSSMPIIQYHFSIGSNIRYSFIAPKRI